MQKNANRAISIPMHKSQVQVDQRPQHKSRYMNQIDEKVRNNFEHIGTGDNFLNRTPITWVLRLTINKWDLMKLKSFSKAKDTINKTIQQTTE